MDEPAPVLELNRRRLLVGGGSGAALALAAGMATGERALGQTDTGEPFWMLNVQDFGAEGDGSTDDTAAINSALQELGSKPFSGLYFPPGNYVVSGSLTPLTRSSIGVFGAGPDVTRFTVEAGAGSMGTLFRVGSDAAPTCGRVTLADFGINYLNSPQVDQNAFVVQNANDVQILNIWLNNPAGLITVGSTANQCSRVRVMAVRGNYRATLDGNKVINLVRAINAHFTDVHMVTGTSSGGGYSIYVAPPSSGFIDTVRVQRCAIWAENQPHGVYLDFSGQKIVNVWIEESIFDQTSAAAFTVRSSGGSYDFRSLWVSDCRATTNSGKAIEIAHAGSGPLGPVTFLNNLFDYADDYAVLASGREVRGLSFVGNDFRAVTNRTKPRAAMRFSCSHWEAFGNRFRPYRSNGTFEATNPDYAVETGSDVDEFACFGNSSTGLRVDFFKHYPYAAESPRRIEGPNMGAKRASGLSLVPALELDAVAREPLAPATGKARLFVRTSNGRAELCVRFPSGSSQVLARQS
jgi:hypothetical protein